MLDTMNATVRGRMARLALYGAVLGQFATPDHVDSSLEWQAFMDGIQLRIPQANWSLSTVSGLDPELWLMLMIEPRLFQGDSRTGWWA